MKRKRICAWFITLAMLLTMLPSALAASFADTRGHWAEDAISRWSDRGVIQGHNGDFEPDSAITRADMAVIIDRIMDYQTKAENKFSDLDNAYYKDPILRVAQAGVMQGDGKNVRPKDKITREEAVSMLARALSVTAGGSSTSFADNNRISSWAMANVAAFAKNGYIAGRSGNRFEPQANITRAEVVKLLDNMISDYITESGTVTPKGTGIVIVKASGVTLNKAKLSGTVILGGKAGEVKATGCEITGKVVKIHNSTLTTGSTGSSSGGSSGGSSSTPAAPSAYPLPKGQETSKSLGVFNYDMTYFVTLTAQDGADIYYEIAEGADKAAVPTTASKKFDTYQYRQIEITQPTASAKGPVTKTYNVKAVAVKNGRTSSVANWNYDVTSIPHHELKVGVPKDWNGSDVPNVTLIQDYDSDKMYLVEGTGRAMVLDAGYFDAEDAANLYETARKIVGAGKPIDLIIGHPHPDHVQMTHQFLCKENKDLGAKVYVNERGIEVLRDYVKQFGVASGMFADEAAASAAYDAQLATLKNGDVYDMGGTKFNVIELPGHQVAGIMLFDAATGNLFTTDQIGNNRAHITDSFWMQFADLSPTFFADSMDVYLSSLQIALERVDSLGTVKRILTGHNDVVLDGTAGYLDNLQTAVQKVVDEGWSAATPTLRTLDSFKGYLENTKTVVVGDRLKDINWVGINVNKQNYLSDGYRDGNQNKIADLSNLSVHKQGEKGNLLWNDPNFGINVNWQYPTDGTKPTRKNTTSFVAEVDEKTTSIEIVPTAASSGAKITINGEAAESGKAYVGKLKNGLTNFTVKVIAKDGTTEKEYTVVVRTHIDPENPYATMYTGEHTETVTLANGETRTFTSYVPEGARESCAGVFVLPNKGESKFDEWKALADRTDTLAIDADWTKQQEKFIVVYLNGLTYGTSAAERAADIDYVNKVYAAASGRTMYCIHEAKNYMVGYGEGGTIAQMAAMDQTAVWAGLATVDAGPVDAAWIAENGAKMASSLNGYNDVESSTRKSTIPKSTLPLPVWMIGSVDNNANALAYWKAADHITDSDKAADGNITKYTRSADWTADENAYKINRDTAAYRIWTSESAPENTESTIWNDFLFGVRRWMADPGGDLRVTKDPIADLHMTRHYEKVGGWMREWYVYVPENAKNSTNLPVVFANHGYTLNGGVYAGQTDWHKVADEKGFIVVFPSAIPGSISENGNAPFPAWNIAMDPTRMDEIEFFKYMLDDLKEHYSIDTGRVYATGHSWGSQMTHVLALNEPEMFAAVAPLSGFIFNAAVFEQAEATKAKGSYPGVPVYMAAGTEGGTEWAICPVPLAEENSSGKTLSDWFALNGCTGSLDWSKINGSNETKGSLDWQNGGAFTKSGRWYTMTCEKDGVPMVQAEIVDYMPHATMPEHSARVWNNWLSHYSRNADGTLVYNP